ncbi:SHOCT domain-containing protein [Oerskovia turbata]|uniref:SHOCT domain-containing protein n=1 Tax=Oerskovia turbata TaxID=1713 RepID=A0A4Q1KUJ6_9CELL|nr:SHOCT domain-containing protein [Oerskovia turbata]RXR25477.1 SHOCT domain-containing protein [Oerskovia turbata]RXR33883.1 SHOCT domain-containing protein [Oerskovia turbata]TGJ95732.1 SHOCT domain-containing protein [Actinotalea fermentans ATCC 43279 = JCM 9966 = DSM 3133]
MEFWDFFWLLIWWFVFIAYLMVLFQILTDLFRDHTLSGWWKAVWIVGLVLIPFLTALIYIIARGRGMTERHLAAASAAKAQADSYIREVATGGQSPTDQIASAKALLDAGTITPDEFASLKAKALA